MNTTELFDECREIQRIVAPELSARPLYIVTADALAGLPYRRDYLGLALIGWAPDWNLASRIREWRGPGAVVALDLQAIERHAAPGQFERCVRNVFVHELGHLVPSIDAPRVREGFEPTQETLAMLREMVHAAESRPTPEPGSLGDHHGWRFIRHTLHLWHRATVAGFDVPLGDLLTQNNRAESYLPFVCGEAVRMAKFTFHEIALTPPPPGLLEQFAEDVRWHKHKQLWERT